MPCWEEENDGYPLNRKPVDHWIIWGPIFQTNPHVIYCQLYIPLHHHYVPLNHYFH